MKPLIIAMNMAAALMLSGCGANALLTSKEPQQTIYTLRPAQADSAPAIPADAPMRIVEIAHITVPPGMDRDRIALYMNDGQKLDYYAAARWSATLDDVIQNVTRRTASTILPYVIAVTPEQTIEAQYRLQIKINDFQPIYGADLNAAPHIQVGAEFTLIALPSDTVVSSFTLSKRGKATSNRLDVVTAGLEKMLQEIEHEAFLTLDTLWRAPE